jgi:hypothetical protein
MDSYDYEGGKFGWRGTPKRAQLSKEPRRHLGKGCEVENLRNRSVDSYACQPEFGSCSGMTSASRPSDSSYRNPAWGNELKPRWNKRCVELHRHGLYLELQVLGLLIHENLFREAD